MEKTCKEKCPKCLSNNISYGGSDIQDNFIIYEAYCLDCRCEFQEEYTLVYNITTYEK